MQVGLCGFPGSGKSTVFRALAPGVEPASPGRIARGTIKVPDARVDRLAEIYRPKKVTHAEITFVDVPGQPGRHGAAFTPEVVQAMRNATVLAHVVRAFDSPYHAEPADPAGEVARFDEELVLLDLGILERRLERMRKENRKGLDRDVTERCVAHLEEAEPLRTLGLSDDELATLQGIQLLSLKPLIRLFNVGEDDWEGSPWRTHEDPRAGATLALSGALEAEIAQMPEEEQREMLEGLCIGEPARHEFVRAAYRMLDLVSFLTCGPDECRAWPIRRGTTARRAAGRIHSDLERGFIRAEVFRLEDLEELGDEAALKRAGRLRVEGKDYVVQDGDILHIRFNV